MTGKHPPSQPDDRAGWFDDEPDDDRFNEVIEGMIRGDRHATHDLDPAMRATVDQLFGWAETSGFAQEPPSKNSVLGHAGNTAPGDHSSTGATSSFLTSPAAMLGADTGSPSIAHGNVVPMPPPAGRAVSGVTRSFPSRLVAAISGLAVVVLLGLAGYGAFSLATVRQDEPDPGNGHLAAIATDAPLPTPYPTLALDSDASYAIPPLTSDDCAADPRSRDGLLGILATPPGAEIEPAVPSVEADAITRDAINTLLRSWWTCHAFGLTWRQTAYESEQYIRMAVYPHPKVDTAFSPSTLDEILDAQAQVDARRISMLPPATLDILTVAPNSEVRITPKDGQGPPTVLATVVVVSASTGTVEGGTWEMIFVYEDGAWKIRADDPRQSSPLPDW